MKTKRFGHILRIRKCHTRLRLNITTDCVGSGADTDLLQEIQASERWNALGQGFSYMIHFYFYRQLKTQLHKGVDYLPP